MIQTFFINENWKALWFCFAVDTYCFLQNPVVVSQFRSPFSINWRSCLDSYTPSLCRPIHPIDSGCTSCGDSDTGDCWAAPAGIISSSFFSFVQVSLFLSFALLINSSCQFSPSYDNDFSFSVRFPVILQFYLLLVFKKTPEHDGIGDS